MSDLIRVLAKIGRVGCKCDAIVTGQAICGIHALVFEANQIAGSVADQILEAIRDSQTLEVTNPTEKECMEEFEP